jgi:hypothetical protein
MFARIGVVIVLSVACTHGGTAPAPASASAPASAPAPVPSTGDRPWGSPVASDTTESAVKRTLALIGSAQARPSWLAPALTVGPALWGILVKLDPPVASAGTATINALPHKKGPAQKMEMRTFADDRALILLLQSPGFIKIGRAFSQGVIRPATDAEREIFYDFVPFEIAGQPVTIFERKDDRMVVYLDDHERIAWIDVLSGYATTTTPAPAPAPAGGPAPAAGPAPAQ